ncbi:MAG: ROK family protein [Daejeonella sp.]
MSVIAIDLGGTRIKTGIIENGAVGELSITDISINDGLSQYLPSLKDRIKYLQQQSDSIEGIGIAFPGVVDTKRNTVIGTSGKYNDACTLDLVQWAEKEFGLALLLENDARLACLGEWRYGAGQGFSDMVMCTLGTGVGSAAIIDHKILRGKHYQAGILGGHSIIDFNNTENKCSCGNYGCVEATASTWMIGDLAKRHPLFAESKLSKLAAIDLQAVFQESEAGDALAGILRDHCMKAWGIGLINLIHAYDPEVVVIGGGIIHSKEIILPYFRKIIAERAWCASGMPEIRAAHYPDSAALLGTTTLFTKNSNE